MRLLYVPCGHPLQEADDCLMWQHLGIEWFSTGYYSRTNQPGDLPYIDVRYRDKYIEQFLTQNGSTHPCDREGTACGKKNKTWTNLNTINQWDFDADFLNRFDVVLFAFFVQNVERNIQKMKGTTLLKTFGMHQINDERKMKMIRKHNELKIIRNSPVEYRRVKRRLYAGEDAVIRGSVVRDEYEISGWVGDVPKVATFTSYMKGSNGPTRKRKTMYYGIKDKCKYPMELYGIGNNFVSHQEKLNILKSYRVNLVTGTPGANNTYSLVEAWVMGQPLVVFGKNLWQSGTTYEIDQLITHGADGFIANSELECAAFAEALIENDELAQNVSRQAREKAVSIYGREALGKKWKEFFNEL